MPTQRCELVAANVHTIHGDTATRHVVKARDQLRDRALPTPDAAEQGNDLARRCTEGNVVQHRDVRTVAKAHVLELSPCCEMWEGKGLRGKLDFWNQIEILK